MLVGPSPTLRVQNEELRLFVLTLSKRRAEKESLTRRVSGSIEWIGLGMKLTKRMEPPGHCVDLLRPYDGIHQCTLKAGYL